MTDPGQITDPTPEAPQQAAWQAPPTGPAKDAGPAPGVAYADLGIRVVAYIIDAIIAGILFFAIGAIIIGVVASIEGMVGALISLVFLVAFNVAFSAIYFIYSWTTLRASPGQKVLNLETVNAADGATLTQPQAIRRWLWLFGPYALLSALSLVVGGAIGGLFSLASVAYGVFLLYTVYQHPKRQGYHDVQASTVVVRRST